MAKKEEDTSFRITIDKRITKAFNNLPDSFTIGQLCAIADIKPKDQKSMYDQLERMVALSTQPQIYRQSSLVQGDKYRCRDKRDSLKTWLIDYYELVKAS